MATVTIIISDREDDPANLDMFVSSDGDADELTTAEVAAQFMVTALSGQAQKTNVTVVNSPGAVHEH